MNTIKNKGLIAILIITLLLITGSFFLKNKTINVNALTYTSDTLSCSVTNGACNAAGESIIFKMDNSIGSSAEKSDQTVYSYKVCCKGLAGVTVSNSCTDEINDTVLNLSAVTDAHVQQDSGSYTEHACLSATRPTTCGYSNSSSCASLGTNYVCLAAMSATDNAHVSSCDAVTFPSPVYACCKISSTPITTCTAKAVYAPSISLGDINIQFCTGLANLSNSLDPCYNPCWKGTGVPDLTSSDWKCAICYDASNNPVSCLALPTATYQWVMPTGYVLGTHYTLEGGTTLTQPNPIIKFADPSGSRQVTLNIDSIVGTTCTAVSKKMSEIEWEEKSPF
ncbi:MAG: hypothetical protein WC319_04850 [Candidatus Paceibacterota bacterium]